MVDDGGASGRAFRRAMIESGVPEGTEDMAIAERFAVETMGQPKITVFRRLFRGVESSAQHANQRFESTFSSIVRAGGVAPLAQSRELLERLSDVGVKTCLTTGFEPSVREAMIDDLGWRDLIDLALSPADAGRGRPWPDMILTALMRLGADDVREIAVVGDTATDLIAGHRAGARVLVGVARGPREREALADVEHSHLVGSVGEIFDIFMEPFSTQRR